MKNSVRLLGATLLLLLGITAPAYSLDAKGVALNDTISIQYDGRYLVSDGSSISASTNISRDALWRVADIRDGGLCLQRMDATGDDGYIRCTYYNTTYCNVELSQKTTASVLIMNVSSGSAGDVEATLSVNITNKKNDYTYYLYVYSEWSWVSYKYKYSWWGHKDSHTLDIEQWKSKKEYGAPTLTCSQSSIAFPFVDGMDGRTADKQATSVTYEVKQKVSTYIGSLGSNTTRLDEKSTEVSVAAQPTFAWRSSKKDVSSLSATQIVNTDEPKQETSRDMLTLATKAGGTANWSVTVTPVGTSPINLRDKGVYTDFTDVLDATVTVDGQTATHELHVTRYAGHYVKTGLCATISPASKQFGSAGGFRQFEQTLTRIEGVRILGARGQVLVYDGYRYDNITTTSIDLSDANLTATYKVLRPDGTVSKDVVIESENPLALSVGANPGSTKREATLYATYTYQGETVTVPVSLVQPGKTEKVVAFHHQPGMGNTALMAGRQAVHTVETDIYYAPNSRVRLTLNEKAFIGYRRWYDYNTDGDPMYLPDGSEIADFWAQGPVGNQAFTPINEGSDSKGRYAYGSMLNYEKTTFPEVNTNAMAGRSYDIACDISAYTDYTITGTAITEPTLSYRQIFHLRPATEIAARIDTCTKNYYETHHFIVPAAPKRPVLLATDFAHYYAEYESELCYFYHDKSGNLKRVGKDVQVTWYKNGTKWSPTYKTARGGAKTDYVEISSTAPGTETYELRIEEPGLSKPLRLVRFDVTYMDYRECGPLSAGVITEQEIKDTYLLLSHEDFNYDKPGTTDVTVYNRHLDWEEATYGYTYPGSTPKNYSRPADAPFPYYGEYVIINRVDKNWAKGEQRGGAANGYCMYVDGTMRTGRVVSINTNTRICKGQQMYCSAWICNPSKNDPTEGGSNIEPRFRFSIQGRNADGEWEDVADFLTGAIDRKDGWQQVLFPVMSASNYDASRVSIYNFSTTNSGNDFLIDDVYLFATKLPLMAYQATTTCASDDREVVLCRLDFTTLTDDWAGKQMYYQIFDITAGKPFVTNYFRDGETDGYAEYGYVDIPAKDYNPENDKDANTYGTASELIDLLKNETGEGIKGEKGFVKVEGKWVLFLGDVVSKEQLAAGHDFEVRMAVDTLDLQTPDCTLRTPLAIIPKSAFLFDGKTTPQFGACSNNLYPLEVKVTNQYVRKSGEVVTLRSDAMADWLVAYEFDTCHEKTKVPENEVTISDAAFLQQYGYKRYDVKEALRHIRMYQDSPNYLQGDVYQLEIMQDPDKEGLTAKEKDLLIDLVERGYLTLAKQTVPCYMMVGDTVMYWVFPILGTAKAENPDLPGDTLALDDCNDPAFMRMSAALDGYVLNLSPVKKEDMDPLLKGLVPAVRVAESEAKSTFSTVVSECSTDIDVVPDDCILWETNDPDLLAAMANDKDFAKNFAFTATLTLDDMNRSVSAGTLSMQTNAGNKYQMRAGYEYTLRVTMETRPGVSNFGPCAVGFGYFTVKVLHDVQQWTPTFSNEWGDDRNWRAVVDGKVLDRGAAPLRTTDAIIPADAADYPCITGNNLYPLDVHYTPHGCRNVRFCKGTMLLNQYLLDYDKAYVDMAVQPARWYTMSAPLRDVYAGDMFVPHSGNYTNGVNLESADNFSVSTFKGTRTTNAAYAFWTAFYNRNVVMHHTPGSSTTQYSSNAAEFAYSNDMSEPFAPGQGLQILGFGPDNLGEKELLVRLPKQDTKYQYYDMNTGAELIWTGNLDRANSYRLAYTPDANGDMAITMTNVESSRYFLFGNPTMAYINMEKFLADNPALQRNFLYMDGSSWQTYSWATSSSEEALLAPMRSVLLMAENPGTSLTVTLKNTHLTTSADANVAPQAKPRRLVGAEARSKRNPEVMTIFAYTPMEEGENEPYAFARAAIATNAAADNSFVAGEDVPFVSSGVEGKGGVVATPLSVYTVSGEQALMADVRRTVSRIPLGFVLDNSDEAMTAYDHLVLSFSLSLPWTEECYFCDELTGTRVPIYNDTRIRIPMPANHEARYYIEGPGSDIPGSDIPSGVETLPTDAGGDDLSIFVRTDGRDGVSVVATAPMAQVCAYDMLGRKVYSCEFATPKQMHNFRLPSGVAVVEAVSPFGTTGHSKIYLRP